MGEPRQHRPGHSGLRDDGVDCRIRFYALKTRISSEDLRVPLTPFFVLVKQIKYTEEIPQILSGDREEVRATFKILCAY